ncbi:protein kinase [Streptomyces sp. NPDC058614]|uniref:serine/threonine-protein kinase n=1 Tax=Streptomyces sp. NPDC058614 TaxID=3346557 RepID=UPI00365C6831
MTSLDDGAGRVVAGRYRLIRRIGAGGMGRVWLAYDLDLACEVAVKEVAVPRDLPEPQLIARVARARGEARLAARLRDHPHVATVHDVVEEDGLPWIVMEYVPGATTLEDVVREQGPLPTAEAARVGLGVLDALTAGHRLGILHRDVKPANILLATPDTNAAYHEDRGRVLLADYGIALRPDSGEPRLTATSSLVGTPGFLAPERARGAPPSPASDLFSLGATLYFAVGGTGPFDRDSEASTLTALLFEEPSPPDRAGALAPVLLGLLAKDPDQRMGGDEAGRLLTELAGRPTKVVAPPITAPATSPAPTAPATPAAPTAPPTPPAPAAPTTPPAPPAPEPTVVVGVEDQPPDHRESDAEPTAVVEPDRDETARLRNFAAPPGGDDGTPADTGQPEPQPSRRMPRGRIIAILAAIVLIAGGGVWAGTSLLNSSEETSSDSTPSPTGPVKTYGETVELTRELQVGECVSAVWGPEKFNGAPDSLGVVACTPQSDAVDGQVLELDAATSLDDAKENGTSRCEGLLRETVGGMGDARSYALVPSEQGWDSNVHNTACLVFNKTAPLHGPVGTYRTTGGDYLLTTGAVGDCIDTKDQGDTVTGFLADCSADHNEEVVGFVKAPAGIKYGDWDEAQKLCSNKFGSVQAKGPAEELNSWMDTEFRYVMCTLYRTDGKKIEGSA